MFTPYPRFAVVGFVSLVLSPHATAQLREAYDTESIEPQAVSAAKLASRHKVLDEIVDRTNAVRREEDRSPVQSNERLEAAAQYFAEYMAKHDKFGHTADEKRPAERAAEHKYEFCVVSENIAYRFTTQSRSAAEMADTFVTGWKKSPGHRENMLDPDVQEIGVGIAHSEKSGYVYAVQMFGRPKSAAIEFTLRNTAHEPLIYRIGEQNFELPAGYARTHHQCRPPTVEILAAADAKEPESTFKPENGERLRARRSKDRWRVASE